MVEFTVERVRGNALAPLPVRVRTWEPNHQADNGTNPTEQIHTVTLPALPMTSGWTDYYDGKAGQTVQFSVTVAVDTNFEELDFLKAEILPSTEGLYDSRDRAQFSITDKDRPTITLSANATSITEGRPPLVFNLTRTVNTTEDLIVDVSVDDPGGFLLGNSPSEAVTVPSSIVFAPGDLTKSFTMTPPDDWRDIPNSDITPTVTPHEQYEVITPGTVSVGVADNDVAPQVKMSFNATEIMEVNDLILTITRVGEDKNPLEISISVGLKGDMLATVVRIDAG